MRFYFSLFFFLNLTFCFSQKNTDLSYYFSDTSSFDSKIPKPSSVTLGNKEIGYNHISHDRLLTYMRSLANSSDRITIVERGDTFEGRPLILLLITSKKNHSQIEKLRSEHLALNTKFGENFDVSNMPIVLYQGYSIHGNEPSGTNAAMLYAYYLAASNSKDLLNKLENSIILLDPCMNPDGLQRFAHWANTNKSENLNPDKNDREFIENWPGGRTNHYWFDMNRDWLPVQLPESTERIKTFHKWSPNILTDHHEMGTNSTFFYQPGVPNRVNPLTPIKNQDLTAKIGKFHEKRLSEIGSLFYSEENFDDFYYGKGSTFPDINGSIGILFEQASSRGHLQESINGLLSFPFTIKNQLITSFSSLEAAIELKNELLNYQKQFYKDSRKRGLKFKNNYFLVSTEKDKSRLFEFYKILKKHKIQTKKLNKKVSLDNKEFNVDNSILIPKNQNKIKLLEAMFNDSKEFKDSLFYDVSAWSFLHSFNLKHTNFESKESFENLTFKKPQGKIINSSKYAYIFPWDDYFSPKVLYKLLDLDIRLKVATEPFEINSKKFDYGSILIHLNNQKLSAEEISNQIISISKESGVDFYGFNSSYSKGIDLGSNRFENIIKPKIAMIVGDGVRSYDAGEIWHLLDTRFEIPITKIKKSRISSYDLSKYNTLIMVNGSYNFDKKNISKIKSWINDGGNLIGFRNNVNWLQKNNLIKVELNKNKASKKGLKFKDIDNHFGSQLTSGAIFQVDLDRSHPISFGYSDTKIPIFRNTNIYIKNDSVGYNNPIKYTKSPLISGYISKENLISIKNSRPFYTTKYGKGRVSVFTDNTNFRAFWYGTNKLMMNAIFFADVM
ncbi:MAG: M14 metallopeptidase family protein [Flavobacteriaceae bacterium]